MGTRADFYIGRGLRAVWLGSIAYDGYFAEAKNPNCNVPPLKLEEKAILEAKTSQEFRSEVEMFLITRADSTTPSQGWPWPWEDSSTTDYAYAFDEGRVWVSVFGHSWCDVAHPPSEEEFEALPKDAVFPDMTEHQVIAQGARSGILLFEIR